MIPVIPTTLSQRTFEQLLEFFQQHELPTKRIHAFFSMVQGAKTLHGEMIVELTRNYPKQIMTAKIPFASEIERMGITRAPVLATTPNSPAGKAYQALFDELIERIAP